MAENPANRQLILLVVWDGLRPDMITAERTPFLDRMAQQGVLCRANHAVFPTATRINSAALTTGCYPGQHGIVDNELYIPSIDTQRAISCADWTLFQKLADLEGGRLLDVPTLGEVLQGAGKKMVSVGSGSPGTTYLTDPTITGPVVNWATAWPQAAKAEIERRYGSFLGMEATSAERNQFIFQVLQDYLIPEHQPDLIRIWLTEPDHSQHQHGLASPEVIAILAELDRHFEHFWGDLGERYGQENLTCFLLSDHGFTTISKRVDPDQALVEAGLKASPTSNDIVRTSNSFYLTGSAQDRLGDIVRFLQGEPWVGALFLRDDLLEVCPEMMPQSAAFGNHRRSAEIMFAYQWSAAENVHGVPGCVIDASGMVATHGSASPYAINNTLAVWGKGIKKGVVSTVPCSIIDLAPTILHLFEIRPPREMVGRFLYELLEEGPSPEALVVTQDTWEATYQTANGLRHQIATYSKVGGYRYLDQVRLSP